MGEVASKEAGGFYRIAKKLKVNLECFLFSQRKRLHVLDYLASCSLAHVNGVFPFGKNFRAEILAVYSKGIDDVTAFFLHHLHDLIGLINL